MKSTKTSKLRDLQPGEIETKLTDSREELMKLRFQQVSMAKRNNVYFALEIARMAATSLQPHEPMPRDSEIDAFGLTHVGKARHENQDHFLLSFIRKRLDVIATSLTDLGALALPEERLAAVGLLAAGVTAAPGFRCT